jgi:uncharacterized protein (TIGR03435 family)
MNRFLCAVLLGSLACGAQPAANPQPEFDVATIKLVPAEPVRRQPMGMRGGPGTADPTRLTIENFPLVLMVRRAFGISHLQLAGLGDMKERFNVTAKIPEGTTETQFRLMLQNLLTERFQIKLHHETREMPVYEMTVGKNGPAFKQHVGAIDDFGSYISGPPKRNKDGFPIAAPGSIVMSMSPTSGARGSFTAVGETMADFAVAMADGLGRPVVDATGLKGGYDFLLTWSMDRPDIVSADRDMPGPEDLAPVIMAAVDKQLGLKMEKKKGPVDVIVIDHFERMPGEN